MKPALVVWDGKSNPEPPPVRLALVHDGSGITLCSVDDRGHVINCGEIASISIDDQYRNNDTGLLRDGYSGHIR